MKILKKIAVSFFISFIFIWIIGYLFKDSLLTYSFDPILNRYVHTPGSVYKQNSEGAGITYVGKHGVNAIVDISKNTANKIVIWGDSYVEAHQVNDYQKMPQIVTSLLKMNGYMNYLCFGVGMSGDSVTDYYSYIPKYERNISSIKSHFILITNIEEETLPDQDTDSTRSVFVSNPLRINYIAVKPEYQELKRILNKWGLYFIWDPVRLALTDLKKIFSPADSQKPKTIMIDKAEAWSFLFSKLRQQTNLPITFVFCPDIPKIENGEIILSDRDVTAKQLFKSVGSKFDIGFIDLTNDFVSFYKKTGKLPRGFNNSKPGAGHFNEHGHELVAQAILGQIIINIEGNYAIYKD